MRWTVLAVSVGLVAAVAGCTKSGGASAKACGGPADAQPVARQVGGYLMIGEPPKLSTQPPVPVAAILADPAKYDGKELRITGQIAEMCEKKGCWITLADAATKKDLFVKFTCSEEGGRIVPMEAAGRTAIIEGVVSVTEISEDEARHYAEDKGASKAEIAKIVGPQKQIRVSSPNVQIAMK